MSNPIKATNPNCFGYYSDKAKEEKIKSVDFDKLYEKKHEHLYTGHYYHEGRIKNVIECQSFVEDNPECYCKSYNNWDTKDNLLYVSILNPFGGEQTDIRITHVFAKTSNNEVVGINFIHQGKEYHYVGNSLEDIHKQNKEDYSKSNEQQKREGQRNYVDNIMNGTETESQSESNSKLYDKSLGYYR